MTIPKRRWVAALALAAALALGGCGNTGPVNDPRSDTDANSGGSTGTTTIPLPDATADGSGSATDMTPGTESDTTMTSEAAPGMDTTTTATP